MDKIKPFVKKDEETRIRDLAKDEELKKKMLKKKTSVVSLIVFIICTLLILSILSPAAAAEDEEDEVDDSDDDGIDDETEEHNERGLHIDIESYEVELKSVSLVGETFEEIEMELHSEEGVKIQMEFNRYNNTLEPEIEITVEFREIIEFEDTNDNGIYDSGDEGVAVYDLRNKEYNEIQYTTQTTQDGEAEHILTAETSDNVFRVVVHAVGNFAVIESGTLSPSEVKIDLIIQDFPYTEDDTQLALMAKLESEEEMEEEHGEGSSEIEDDDRVTITAADAEAYFSWADTADVDGVETPVKTSIESESDGDLRIYFTYKRGTVINHDPKLGVPFLTLSTVTPDSDGDSDVGLRAVTYLGALGLGAAVIGGAVYWRRKKNGY